MNTFNYVQSSIYVPGRVDTLVTFVAEQERCKDASPPADKPYQKDNDDKDDEMDDFDKRWEDIKYLIRKPFCCK